jgi:hypothetical protein
VKSFESARAVLVDHSDGMALVVADGRPHSRWLPVGYLEDISVLLGRSVRLFERYREGVLVLSGTAPAQLGFPSEPPATHKAAAGHPALARARASGWIVTEVGPWMTFRGEDSRPRVHVALYPWLGRDQDAAMFPEPHGLATAAEATVVLARFHELAGGAFHASPGCTGIALLRDHYRPQEVATVDAHGAGRGRAAEDWAPGVRLDVDGAPRATQEQAPAVPRWLPAPVRRGAACTWLPRRAPSWRPVICAVPGRCRGPRSVPGSGRSSGRRGMSRGCRRPIGWRPRERGKGSGALWVTGPTMRLL